MTTKNLLLGLVCTGLLTSFSAYADSENECGLLEVQIANMTNSTCILQNKNVIHGSEVTVPPIGIIPGDSKRFMLKQAIFGPRISLTYKCGNQTITFESRQNRCMLWAGAVNGEKTYEELNLTAEFKASRGSSLFNNPGQIEWILETRS